MEPTERRAILILADISGYTRFMVANQLAAVHGQAIITFLIETLLKEVDIPLTLHGIEGDAVFLSASHPGTEEGWRSAVEQVSAKLDRFFEVFLEGIVRLSESTPCECPSCKHVEQLRLKIIVHSGRAVFHTIAGLSQASGTDVILAHRLLKNSVPSHEYLLLTDAAWCELGAAMPGTFTPGEEECEGIGKVKTWVRLMDAEREHTRDAFYARPAEILAAEGRGYGTWMAAVTVKAAFTQLRHPSSNASWPARFAFTLKTLLQVPRIVTEMRRVVPPKVLAQKARRQEASAAR